MKKARESVTALDMKLYLLYILWRENSHHKECRVMSKGFIRYETKNGVEYASVYKARRDGGKKVNDILYWRWVRFVDGF